ncbi:DNA repair protein RecO [Oscillatoria sp. FACHB-1407]|uniref:DNA repair protein RecO n=1 Tax=Oscillatoria sp. FACHB-1407 TaxID=2692847 RepID=UPI00168617D4|nr:DNA repair protein RecO [Oscillatoria sp. FACHB-1407]MBD2462613.1 DNA repair protein RecO [Oscillatoria sp. FACHB-1407]
MAGTYKATGINLKGIPLGESDRLLTVLTREFGLIRLVAPGARKHQSSLRGRSGLFVVNELLIVKGKSLDKIIQAESLESYPSLSQDLRKLTASQYIAELALYQALSDQPQDDLFDLLNQLLSRIEQQPGASTLAILVQGIFHLLTLAGVAPQVNKCCLTQQALMPDLMNSDWRVGFSASAGGTVDMAALKRSSSKPITAKERLSTQRKGASLSTVSYPLVKQSGKVVEGAIASHEATHYSHAAPDYVAHLDATELTLLQRLAQSDLPSVENPIQPPQSLPSSVSDRVWLSVERVLRNYAQYHFEKTIRSATLVDTCFLSTPLLSPEP